MIKVAIAAVHWKHNHGSMLQCLALQRVLTDMDINNEIIDMTGLHAEIRKNRMSFFLRQFFSLSFIQAKLGKVKFELIYKKRVHGLDDRKRHFVDFENRFVLSQRFYSMADLTKACFDYSHVMAGSDQLWLPINVAGDYYTLNFVPDSITKVSYATSFGVSDIPKRDRETYKQFIGRIHHLSVRENSGQKLIQSLTGQEAEVVCDPTLLFDKEGWETLIPLQEKICEQYIFCYFLGGNKLHREFVNNLKKFTNLPIVAMVHMEEYHPVDNSFADYPVTDAGPCEFVNLIRNADYVCTDSYHGSIFSIIHQKCFWVFKRHNDNSLMSTNTRINSLLEVLGLTNRYLTGSENVEDSIEIDYDAVSNSLQTQREKAMQFLKNSLGL